MPELIVNGQGRQYAAEAFPATLAALLAGLGLESARVVAEVDGKVVRREDFSTCRLAPGARIELVRFVGGG